MFYHSKLSSDWFMWCCEKGFFLFFLEGDRKLSDYSFVFFCLFFFSHFQGPGNMRMNRRCCTCWNWTGKVLLLLTRLWRLFFLFKTFLCVSFQFHLLLFTLNFSLNLYKHIVYRISEGSFYDAKMKKLMKTLC